MFITRNNLVEILYFRQNLFCCTSACSTVQPADRSFAEFMFPSQDRVYLSSPLSSPFVFLRNCVSRQPLATSSLFIFFPLLLPLFSFYLDSFLSRQKLPLSLSLSSFFELRKTWLQLSCNLLSQVSKLLCPSTQWMLPPHPRKRFASMKGLYYYFIQV